MITIRHEQVEYFTTTSEDDTRCSERFVIADDVADVELSVDWEQLIGLLLQILKLVGVLAVVRRSPGAIFRTQRIGKLFEKVGNRSDQALADLADLFDQKGTDSDDGGTEDE